MTVGRPKNLNSPLLFTAILLLLHSLSPRFCRAQGNNSSSTTINPCRNCGPFGFCNSQTPTTCTCLQGFSPLNKLEWDSGNWTSGCDRNAPLNCQGGREDEFLNIQTTNLTGYEADRFLGPEIRCRARCLRTCSCVAYAFDNVRGCMVWNGTLIDLQISPNGSGSTLNVRVSNPGPDKKKGSSSTKIVIIVVVVGFVIISISACISWRWIANRRDKRNANRLGNLGTSDPVDISPQDALSDVNLRELPLFKLEVLVNATNNFSEAKKLGTGGFGSVYKGELTNGREIAVKRLSLASGQGMQEFMNEVVLISKLQHRNLVRLFGCCMENNEKMLIYEYMPNKSLDFYLFDTSQEILDWIKRFKIMEGICRGLLYLHRDSRLKIIHRDLKPSNILLDNDWNPKISDFGMARIYGTKQDHVSTERIVGTFGYMAPEYAARGKFSEKSDVYSLGVIMLAIATGRRNTGFHDQEDDSFNLLGHIWKLWNEDSVAAVIDPRISSLSYREEVMRCIHIGLLCVQQLPKDRPSVSGVLSMLSSEIVELPEPKKPAFVVTTSHPDGGTSSSKQSQQSSSSLNDYSLSTVAGR